MEPLVDLIANLPAGEGAAIHIGFWRPETAAVVELIGQCTGALLASPGSVWAFPGDKEITLSVRPVGVCDGLPFHAIVQGFGRYMADVDAAVALPPSTELAEAASREFLGWVADLVATNPKLGADLKEVGIWDDDSYLRLEQRLARGLRARLGRSRFLALVQAEPDHKNVIANLRACPPWLLDLPLHQLALTVRQENVLQAHNLHAIGDLAPLGVEGLLKLPSFGRLSMFNLGTLVHHAFVSEQGLAFDGSLSAEKIDPSSLEVDDATPWNPPAPVIREQLAEQCPELSAHESFLSGLLETVSPLNDNQQLVLRERMGFRCEPQTLQQVAEKMGLTRERVRQIEQKAYRRLRTKPLWGELHAKIAALLKGRTSPLLLRGMEALDPWFKGMSDMAHPLREISRQLLSQKIGVFEASGTMVVSEIWESEWEHLKGTSRAMLSANAADRITETRARAMVDGLLVGAGEELREELWAIASAGSLWTEASGNERRLAGFTGSAEESALAVLRGSSTPLRVAEIHQRIAAAGDVERSEQSVRNACLNVAMLYARGVYGLAEHCPLDSAQLEAIRGEVDDIMGAADLGKQWHTSELLDELIDRGLDFNGMLTKYLVNIALRGSPHLSYLGRMVWRHKSEADSRGASDRLDIRQAVIALLENEGQPMTTSAIRGRLMGERGVNSHFQIHPDPPLLKIGPGVWGLLGRDVSVESATPMIERLKARLSDLGHGIHVTELSRELDIPALNSEREVHKLVALARLSGVRIDRSQYVYSEQWSSSRRVSIGDAVTLALAERAQDGAALDYICERVRKLTLRDIPRLMVSQLLQHIDAEYDGAQGVWRMVSTDESTSLYPGLDDSESSPHSQGVARVI
ncbi:MAG: hypothetical protein GXD23_13085 [Comamonadaceae bacterium]|jgi:hypothetical protein|nr:hypothetical protein [Comamonadaceae bacterium]